MFLPFIASNALSSGAEGLRGRQHHITQQYTYTTSKSGLSGGGAGGVFGRSINPISTRGKYYANRITIATPRFSDIPTALKNRGQ